MNSKQNVNNVKNVNLYPAKPLDLFYMDSVVLYKQQMYDVAMKHNIPFSKLVSMVTSLTYMHANITYTPTIQTRVERVAKPIVEKDVHKLFRDTHQIYSQILDKDPLVKYIRDMIQLTKRKLYSIIDTCQRLREIFGKQDSLNSWTTKRINLAYDCKQKYDFDTINLARKLQEELRNSAVKPKENKDVLVEEDIKRNAKVGDLKIINNETNIKEVVNEVLETTTYQLRSNIVDQTQTPKLSDKQNFQMIEESKSESSDSVEYKEITRSVLQKQEPMTIDNLMTTTKSLTKRCLLNKILLVESLSITKQCYEESCKCKVGECIRDSLLNRALDELKKYNSDQTYAKGTFKYDIKVPVGFVPSIREEMIITENNNNPNVFDFMTTLQDKDVLRISEPKVETEVENMITENQLKQRFDEESIKTSTTTKKRSAIAEAIQNKKIDMSNKTDNSSGKIGFTTRMKNVFSSIIPRNLFCSRPSRQTIPEIEYYGKSRDEIQQSHWKMDAKYKEIKKRDDDYYLDTYN